MSVGDPGHTGKGEVPDGIVPILGYRKWQMKDSHLAGLTFPQLWTEGVNVAECLTVVPAVTPLPPESFRRMYPSFVTPANAHLVGPGRQLSAGDDGRLAPAPGYAHVDCPGVASLKHQCGFYARHLAKVEVDVPSGTGDYTRRVSGIIKAWGRVTYGSIGFRAEKAEIVALVAYTLPERSRVQVALKEGELAESRTPMRRSSIIKDILRLEEPLFEWPNVRENYPNVPVFDTEEEMLAHFQPWDASGMEGL